MTYPLNNVQTADGYTAATEAVFPRPTNGFTIQVYNAAVYYTLLLVPTNSLRTEANQSDSVEHFLAPCAATFDESDLPSGTAFAGIKFRSASPGIPAMVTV